MGVRGFDSDEIVLKIRYFTHYTYLTPPTFPWQQLFDIVFRYDTLQNVISSVTRNGSSILLTAILAVILIYVYSIIGYMFFSEDFMMQTNPMEQVTALNDKACLKGIKGESCDLHVICIK